MNTMRTCYVLAGVLVLLVDRPMAVCAGDLTAKVIDRLGRPVTDAVVDIHWLKSVSKDDVRKIDLVKLVSDRDGIVKGTYDEKSVPKGEHIWGEFWPQAGRAVAPAPGLGNLDPNVFPFRN